MPASRTAITVPRPANVVQREPTPRATSFTSLSLSFSAVTAAAVSASVMMIDSSIGVLAAEVSEDESYRTNILFFNIILLVRDSVKKSQYNHEQK